MSASARPPAPDDVDFTQRLDLEVDGGDMSHLRLVGRAPHVELAEVRRHVYRCPRCLARHRARAAITLVVCSCGARVAVDANASADARRRAG